MAFGRIADGAVLSELLRLPDHDRDLESDRLDEELLELAVCRSALQIVASTLVGQRIHRERALGDLQRQLRSVEDIRKRRSRRNHAALRHLQRVPGAGNPAVYPCTRPALPRFPHGRRIDGQRADGCRRGKSVACYKNEPQGGLPGSGLSIRCLIRLLLLTGRACRGVTEYRQVWPTLGATRARRIKFGRSRVRRWGPLRSLERRRATMSRILGSPAHQYPVALGSPGNDTAA
jgi:hypothetical protein